MMGGSQVLKKRCSAVLVTTLLLSGTFMPRGFAGGSRGSDDSRRDGGRIKPIKDLPEPETFTERLYNIPDPFTSWEGIKVRAQDWRARPAQLRQIMEHYETGYMPSTKGITVSLEVTTPQTSYTVPSGAGAVGEFMTAVFNRQDLRPKFHVQPFPINDPRSLYDYKKLDWAAPGYKSLKRQVEKLGLTETDNPPVSVRAEPNKRPR